MFRRLPVLLLLAVLAFSAACTNKKVKNPIANVDSKQPDKVLFDRAMDALKHNRFDVARLTLQTLINTYPDSEFLARAKLGVADSWYAEGGSAGLAQAELEYSDFITFFPNMPEAAEAQLKIGNIHFQQMEKPDRDFTHAARAEQEYRKLIMQWPDSKLVPEAKQRLLEVQEVLAAREYGIGRFYYLRPAYPAAIARLESLVDRYPLYSRADEALYLLGQAYESEIALLEKQKLEEGSVPWKARQRLIDDFTDKAADAYGRILTRYPMMAWAPDAKDRLEALHKPVPRPTKAMVAQNKKEEESRKENGTLANVMGAFRKRPDVSQAVHVGDPTLTDTTLTSASEVVQQAAKVMVGSTSSGGGGTVSVETVGNGTPPPSDAPPSSSDGTNKSAGGTASTTAGELAPNVPDNNELKPNVSQGADGALPPAQVNQIDPNAPAEGAASAGDPQSEDADITYSSSKHKKKKGLRKIVPF
ncbi:MAG TPA: outer membrane protein assembly factor BamD [Terriglobales bacterium]|jgi:outer membrane protein assembly factor BamD